MKRTSTDAEYLDSGKLVIDADGIGVTISEKADQAAVDSALEAKADKSELAAKADKTEVELKADKSYVDDTKWPRGAFTTDTLPSMDDAPEGVVMVNTNSRSEAWGLPDGLIGFVVTYDGGVYNAQVFYAITNSGLREHTRKYGSSGWSEWQRQDDQYERAIRYVDEGSADLKSAHIPLNRPWGPYAGHTRSYDNRHCRIPLNLKVPTSGGIRIGFNNVEFLSETVYTAPVVIEQVFVGQGLRGDDGELNGQFAGSPTPLLTEPLNLPTDGSTVFTPWGAEDLTLNQDTIISYGYRSDGESVYLYNQGMGWQDSRSSNAGVPDLVLPSTVSTPLGVTAEVKTSAPSVLVVGDSRAVALATGKPIVSSPVSIASSTGWTARNYAIGGSRFRQWSENTLIWDEISQSGAESVLMILGSNDIFGGGTTLEELKGYFLTTVAKIRAAVGEVPIFTMELYPRFITPAPELVQMMEDFNAWTYGLPGGIDGVVPIGNLIDPSTGAVHAKWMSDDDVHLSLAGNVRLAQNFQIV